MKEFRAVQFGARAMMTKAELVWRCGTRRDETISMRPAATADARDLIATHLECAKDRSPQRTLAVAHAGSFTATLARSLERAGYAAMELRTEATVIHEPAETGGRVNCSALTVRAKVPRVSRITFKALAWDAINNCAISKALRAQIKLDATLL